MTERHRYRLDPARMTYEEAGARINHMIDGPWRELPLRKVAEMLGVSLATIVVLRRCGRDGDPMGRKAHVKLSAAIRAITEGGAK